MKMTHEHSPNTARYGCKVTSKMTSWQNSVFKFARQELRFKVDLVILKLSKASGTLNGSWNSMGHTMIQEGN